MAIRFSATGAPPYQLIDTVCMGPGDRILSPLDLIPQLRQYFERAVPDFAVRFQPPGRTLVNLDTIFYADYGSAARGGQVPFDRTVDVLGFPVRIVASPAWTWIFEPGVARTYETPGAPYPHQQITHRYTTTGAHAVSVEASWHGQFYVAGDGPYPIEQPVTQARTAPVEVVSAHSQLVDATPP